MRNDTSPLPSRRRALKAMTAAPIAATMIAQRPDPRIDAGPAEVVPGPRPVVVVVLGDGSRVQVENTETLRLAVLAIAEKIRDRRRVIGDEIEVRQPAWKCRLCGQRGNCGQITE